MFLFKYEDVDTQTQKLYFTEEDAKSWSVTELNITLWLGMWVTIISFCLSLVPALQESPWSSIQVPSGQWNDDVPHEGKIPNICVTHSHTDAAVTDTVNIIPSIWFTMCLLQVSEEEVTKLLVTGIDPAKEIHPCFAEFTYTPRSLPDDTTPMVRNGDECVCPGDTHSWEQRQCIFMWLLSLCVFAVHPQHVRRHGFHQHIQDWHAHSGQVCFKDSYTEYKSSCVCGC